MTHTHTLGMPLRPPQPWGHSCITDCSTRVTPSATWPCHRAVASHLAVRRLTLAHGWGGLGPPRGEGGPQMPPAAMVKSLLSPNQSHSAGGEGIKPPYPTLGRVCHHPGEEGGGLWPPRRGLRPPGVGGLPPSPSPTHQHDHTPVQDPPVVAVAAGRAQQRLLDLVAPVGTHTQRQRWGHCGGGGGRTEPEPPTPSPPGTARAPRGQPSGSGDGDLGGAETERGDLAAGMGRGGGRAWDMTPPPPPPSPQERPPPRSKGARGGGGAGCGQGGARAGSRVPPDKIKGGGGHGGGSLAVVGVPGQRGRGTPRHPPAQKGPAVSEEEPGATGTQREGKRGQRSRG